MQYAFRALSRWQGPQLKGLTLKDGIYSALGCVAGLNLLALQSRFGDNWGKMTWKLSGLSPKRDWSSKRHEGGPSTHVGFETLHLGELGNTKWYGYFFKSR